MSGLKQALRLKLLPNKTATALLERAHPLGAGRAFSFAFGIFWLDRCEGVMTWGNPVSCSAVQRYGLYQREVLELHKFWISDVPEQNSESRALAVACRLIAKQYPQLRLLLTYCEGDEKATAYRASGWIPQQAYHYLREVVLLGGKVLSLRHFNRQGGNRTFGDSWEGRYVHRRKWVYVLDEKIAPVVQSSIPAIQAEDAGSRPSQVLQLSVQKTSPLGDAQSDSAPGQ